MTGRIAVAEYPKREQRVAVAMETELTLFPGRAIPARLRNLSMSGFYAECGETLAIGRQVIVEIGGVGALAAQVRWSFQGRVGGCFNGVVDRRQRAALARLMAGAA